jgi:hypothetical protein
VQLRCFPDQLRFAHARHNLLADDCKTELRQVEGSEHDYRHISCLHQKLGISDHPRYLTADDVEAGDDVLPLRLTLVKFCLFEHTLDEALRLSGHLFLHCALLVQLLLLDARLELVFVLEGLAAKILLPSDTLFVFSTPLLPQLLLLLHHFAIFLQVELRRVLSLSALHLSLELHGLALLTLSFFNVLQLGLPI